MSSRWQECARIGGILGLPKGVVYNGYNSLIPFLSGIFAQDATVIKKALSLKWYGYDGTTRLRRAAMTDEPPAADKNMTESQKKIHDVKLVMWVVDKIGDLERAKRAFDKVYRLLKDDE